MKSPSPFIATERVMTHSVAKCGILLLVLSLFAAGCSPIPNRATNEDHNQAIAMDTVSVESHLATTSAGQATSAAENFVKTYKTQSINSFDQRLVLYVMKSLFCLEASSITQIQSQVVWQ